MLITEILARNARVYGNEVALIERDPATASRRAITWQAFDIEANRLANALHNHRIRSGDRVVQLMTNCLEWLPIYFGILRSGAWAVPLNFRFLAETIKRCTMLSEANVVIFGEEFVERINAIRPELKKTVELYIFTGPREKIPAYAIAYEDFLKTGWAEDPRVSLELTNPAAIYFTSGTTGTPKGVLLTHRNLESACYVENNHHGQTHADTFLCIPPLYHTGAKMHWFGNLIVGAKAVILKGIEPQAILEAVSEENVTIVWLLVPWAYDILLAIENGTLDLADYQLDQWRLMHIGAQPVPSHLIEQWKAVFPAQHYDTNYGLTEAAGPGCVHLGMDNIKKIGAIGIPGFDWECQIVDRNLEQVPLGEPGELLVKGPGVMLGYYKNPPATEETLSNGWLRTGDIARMDKDGFIWLLDRKKDVVITGGENIYPVEIEDFFIKHPAIQDVAVIGTPDERLGELVTAIVQVKPDQRLSEVEVREFAEGLARYKRPRIYHFDAIPRNPTGKIEKPKLRKKYAGITSHFKR
ncbi:MAG: AMP-dependent synthetase [Deltaproteobacteria bacterium]|nr:MAG: AMP-dependent synthetase [Deltaproteobacteria bacterium]